MRWSRRLLFGIVCVLAVSMAGMYGPRVSAQNATASVNIRRVTALNFEVFTGDFNGDGIVDLVSHQASPGGVPVIALGRGDGTYGAATTIGNAGRRVIGVGDVDKDGKLDLIAEQFPSPGTSPDNTIVVLRGNGNGTFSIANANAGTPSSAAFSLIVDYDGDGKNDLVVAEDNDGDASLRFLRGNGDFTFTFDRIVASNGSLTSGITADVNGDGRPDIVTTGHDARVVSVYLNAAGGFTASDIPLAAQTNDVAAADVDHDGKIDILVATSDDGGDDLFYTGGSVQVLRGNGDGTFQAPRVYASGRGAWKLVVGDFNRDGILDVATANRSGRLAEDYCGHVWDSVSILPGRTDGSFGAPSTFSLGDQSLPTGDRFYNSVMSLRAADLNGDGFLDLATSWGGILLNHAPDTNWTPTVDAGPDLDASKSHAVALFASASDVDQDQLTYRWTDSGGTPMENSPAPCIVSPTTLGIHTFTVTVDDGQGHTVSDSVNVDFGSGAGAPSVSITAPTASSVLAAGQPFLIQWTASDGSSPINIFDLSYSTDDGTTSHPITECHNVPASSRSCQWNDPPATEQARIWVSANTKTGDNATAESARFAVRATTSGGTPLHGDWVHADVGHVGATGSASYDGLVYGGEGLTVTGSGADIWGTADEFHFVWKHFSGDFSVDTRVSSLGNTNAWAKAGLMIRGSATDASSAHASIFVSPSKGIAFQRRTTTGGSSVSTQGPALTAPLWLRMTRQGTLIRAFYRKNITDGWTDLGEQSISTLGGAVDVGVATTSHADGTLATAKFEGVFVGALAPLTSSPFGGATGTISGNGTTFTATGSGSDIWGTSDSFVFFNTPIGENRQITIRVRSLANTDAWAKAGVMIRETLTAGSRQVDTVVSPSKGIAMQDRAATGGDSASPVQMNGAAPIWLRIARFEPSSGTPSFTASYSQDGTTWFWMGQVSVAMTHNAYIGVALTSHKAGTQTTAVIDDIRIEP